MNVRVNIMYITCRGQKYANISKTLIESFTDKYAYLHEPISFPVKSDSYPEMKAKVNGVIFISYHLSRV